MELTILYIKDLLCCLNLSTIEDVFYFFFSIFYDNWLYLSLYICL
uniref:Uncharacterized protein n=1 Tax=Rhizophora mucronata TaxID=61149 RepID=A0A2P2LJ17_RHIMU